MPRKQEDGGAKKEAAKGQGQAAALANLPELWDDSQYEDFNVGGFVAKLGGGVGGAKS